MARLPANRRSLKAGTQLPSLQTPCPPAPCSAPCCSSPATASSSPLWPGLLGQHQGPAPCPHPTLLRCHCLTPCLSVLRHGRRINFIWTSLRATHNFASKDLLKELLIICKADALAMGPTLEQHLLSRVFQVWRKQEHWDGTQQRVAKPLSLLHPSYAFSSYRTYSVVKLLKEGGINPEAFAGRKNNSNGKRKVVNDRETPSLWHNKPPEPRACRQEQRAMILMEYLFLYDFIPDHTLQVRINLTRTKANFGSFQFSGHQCQYVSR